MNLDAVNPELESKINDLVCEAYNKSFLEQEKLLKEAFELIPKPVTQWAHPTTMVAIALFDLYYKNQKYNNGNCNDRVAHHHTVNAVSVKKITHQRMDQVNSKDTDFR